MYRNPDGWPTDSDDQVSRFLGVNVLSHSAIVMGALRNARFGDARSIAELKKCRWHFGDELDSTQLARVDEFLRLAAD